MLQFRYASGCHTDIITWAHKSGVLLASLSFILSFPPLSCFSRFHFPIPPFSFNLLQGIYELSFENERRSFSLARRQGQVGYFWVECYLSIDLKAQHHDSSHTAIEIDRLFYPPTGLLCYWPGAVCRIEMIKNQLCNSANGP